MIVRRLLMPLAVTTATLFCANAYAQGAFPAPLPGQSQPAASPFPPVGGAPSSNASASPFPPVGNSAAPARSAAASPFPSPGGASAPAAAAAPSAFDRGAAPMGGGFGGGMGGPPGGGGGPSAEQQDCMKQFGPLREDAEKRANLVRAASQKKASPQEACKLIGNFHAAEGKLLKFVTSKQKACGIPAEIPSQMKAGHARTSQMLKQVCNVANAPQSGPAAAPSLADVLGTSNSTEVRSVRRGGGSTFDTLNGNVLAR